MSNIGPIGGPLKMSAFYRELTLGSTGYTGSAGGNLALIGQSGGPQPTVLAPFEPMFHLYRVVAGSSGADFFISFDGINDHQRIPFSPSSASGTIAQLEMDVSYRGVWVRSAAGVTAAIGIGMYTRQ